MSEFDMGTLRYFDIVKNDIHTDKPTGEDYLEVVFEEKNTLPDGYPKTSMRAKAGSADFSSE